MLSSLEGGDLCWKKASLLLAKIFTRETSAGPHGRRSDVFTMTGSSPNGTLLQEHMFRAQKEEKRSQVSHTPDQMLSGALEKNIFCKLRARWYPLFWTCGRGHGTNYLETQSTCLKRRTTITSVHTSTWYEQVEVVGKVIPEQSWVVYTQLWHARDNAVLSRNFYQADWKYIEMSKMV